MEAAIISAAVALTIFTILQIIIHLRDRQTFLRGKLEELFSSLNEVSCALTDSYYGAQHYEARKDASELEQQLIVLNKALYKPRSLLLLYFSYLVPLWEGMVVSQIRDYISYCSKTTDDPKDFTSDECKRQIELLSLKIRGIQNFLSRNTGLTTESISFHWKRLLTGKTEIKL